MNRIPPDVYVRNRPFGNEEWQTRQAKQIGLQHAMRSEGRPKATEKGDTPDNYLFRLPKALDLCRTHITDVGIHHFRNLQSLEEIELYNTAVTSAGIVALKEALPRLHVGENARIREGIEGELKR